MTVKIYGTLQSRAYRCIWMARETGIAYENIPTGFTGDNRTPEFLQVNPNGRIPAMQDGDFTLFESMAINLYLAKKYGTEKGLYPKDPQDEARAVQWSFWVMTEVEKPLLLLLLDAVGMAKAQPADIEKANKDLGRPLAVLEQHLQNRPYMLGDSFTVADLNLASVLFWAKPAKLDLTPYPKVAAWLKSCLGRPAAARG